MSGKDKILVFCNNPKYVVIWIFDLFLRSSFSFSVGESINIQGHRIQAVTADIPVVMGIGGKMCVWSD